MNREKLNIIGCKGVTIKGDIESKVSVNVSSDVIGNIYCSDTIIVDNEAVIQGNIDAQTIIIKNGTVNGNLVAHKTVELKCKAVIKGDITSQLLIVDAGAVLNGNCTNWLDEGDADDSDDVTEPICKIHF